PDRERDWIHDASVDLEKALLKRMDLRAVYRSMLAKCFFLTGHFHDAAKQYGSLVQTDPSLHVYKSLALTYRRADEPQKAQKVLDDCAAKFPDEKGIFLTKGEIQAQETDVDGLVDSIRKEFDRNPELEKDWKLSALLALAETHGGAKMSA